MNVLTMLLATFVQSSWFTLRLTSNSNQTVFNIRVLFKDYFPWRHLLLSSDITGSTFIWHPHLFYQNYLQYGCQILHILPPQNPPPYSLPCFQVLSPLLSSFAIIIMINVYLTERVVWRLLQSSSPNQVQLDMCPPCLCTKCPPHVEQNGLFAISFSNSPDSLNLPAMTDMLSDHHHDGHRHDYLTRSCLLAWRYSATWWSATRFSASTRSTCQIKR